MSPVIDVHTHMLNKDWLRLLERHGRYGSDYPHTIGDPVGCLARVDRLPDGARDRVRGGNAGRIFEFR